MLAGRTIALAEGRQLEDLAHMLEQEGATVLRCPLVAILDPPDDGPALAWLKQAGQFDIIVLFTGEGLRRLRACAERHGVLDDVTAALRSSRLVCRGPKPVAALRDMGLTPTLVARNPTTGGVIEVLRQEPLQGRTVGVQLYREDNPPLLDFLRQAGAVVHTVLPYVYAPGTDAERVLDLIEQLAEGKVDAVVFTSSPQVDRLYEVARERQALDRLAQGFEKTRVAAVGPIVAENLQTRGVTVAICPQQGFVMKNLVQHIKRQL